MAQPGECIDAFLKQIYDISEENFEISFRKKRFYG